MSRGASWPGCAHVMGLPLLQPMVPVRSVNPVWPDALRMFGDNLEISTFLC